MNQYTLTYVPVPSICSGVISSYISDEDMYEVNVYDSPLGELNGPVHCSLIYPPGFDGNYKQGTYVKMLIPFLFGGDDEKCTDIAPGAAYYILGTFNEERVVKLDIENPMSENDENRIRFTHSESDAGVVAYSDGKARLNSGGVSYILLTALGNGVLEEANYSTAQNFHRVIANNGPFYLAREHFGMYRGKDYTDKALNIMPDDMLINYRRFVTQSRSPDNWISTCEGAWAPYVGANIKNDEVTKGKETLFSKAINYGNSRITVEMGELGSEFINVRVDDIKINEKAIDTAPGATPALVGNRFKINISEEGELDIRAAGKGVPKNNTNGLRLNVDKDGIVTLGASGKISISHGDADESNNSIVLDPKNGIDITALNGFRVNGQEVITKAFIDWMNKFQASLCQVTSPGGPAPINPAALPEFIKGMQTFAKMGGFSTIGKSAPATGIINDTDKFSSV